MKNFGMPSDFKTETIDKYAELNERYPDSRIMETYGQITLGNTLGSGRLSGMLPEVGLSKLKEYILYSRNKGIDFNYTLNASFMGNMEFTRDGIIELKGFLDKLYEAGVRWLTIAMPSLIELVKSSRNQFKVKASTICQIDNVNKSMWYKDLGVDRIVVPESINRDFDRLKAITAAFGDGVEIIVNSICNRDCINRMFHYNEISGDQSKISGNAGDAFFNNRCLLKKFSNFSNFMKSGWVRPEDIKYYVLSGINYFKLQGRQHVAGSNPALAAEHYMQESFDGNLMLFLNMFSTGNLDVYIDNKKLDGYLEPFYNTPGFCRGDCAGCKYCEAAAKKSIHYEKAEKAAQMARIIFARDPYKRLLKSAEKEEAENSLHCTIE